MLQRRGAGSAITLRVAAFVATLFAAALLAAACGGDPNAVDAEQFFRPPAPAPVAPEAGPTGPAGGADPDSGDSRDTEDRQAEAEAEADADADADGADGADAGGGQADGGAPDAGADPPVGDPGNGVDLADDIVRRYFNSHYEYSLELVCEPFCDAESNGVDRVGFLADSGRALINVRVVAVAVAVEGDGSAGLDLVQAAWEADAASNASFTILDRQETVLASDGVTPARLLDWEIDRRSQGGFEERYRTLLTRAGPIGYIINAGGVADSFEAVAEALQAALDSFLPSPAPPGLPGRFSRWGFALPYAAGAFTAELGNRAAVASYDSGIFLQQAASGFLEMIVIWESVGEAIFDADDQVTQGPIEFLTGIVQLVEESERGDLTLGDGTPGRYALYAAVIQAQGEGQVGAFAWYCADSGRSFTLLSLHPTDARGVVAATLDGFACDTP